MALRLETFATEGEISAVEVPAFSAEDRLAAYDEGYTAGWDDAIAARNDDAARLNDAVGLSLQSLAFGWHEAQQHVIAALRPLLEAMVSHLLPAIAAETLPAVIADALLPLAAERAAEPIVLRLHPSVRAAAEGFLARTTSLTLTLQEDTALSPGQAVLSAGPSGARVDLDAAISEISAAVSAFYELLPSPPLQEAAYG